MAERAPWLTLMELPMRSKARRRTQSTLSFVTAAVMALLCVAVPTASADSVDLAEWSARDWKVTVDGVMVRLSFDPLAFVDANSKLWTDRPARIFAGRKIKWTHTRNTRRTHLLWRNQPQWRRLLLDWPLLQRKESQWLQSSARLALLFRCCDARDVGAMLHNCHACACSISNVCRPRLTVCIPVAAYAGLWIEVDVPTSGSGSVEEPPQGVTIQLSDNARSLAASFAVPLGDRGGEGVRSSVFLPFTSFTKGIRWGCSQCKIDPSSIDEVDVYVLYQPGPFRVVLRRIEAVKSAADVPGVDKVKTDAPTMPVRKMSDRQVRSLIEGAIARGSTAWNKNQPEICGAIYDCTMRSIAGSSGAAASVLTLAAVAVDQASTYNHNTDTNGAWIHRRAFDTMLAAYDGNPLPAASGYPAVAQGDWAIVAIKGSAVPKVGSPGGSSSETYGESAGETGGASKLCFGATRSAWVVLGAILSLVVARRLCDGL